MALDMRGTRNDGLYPVGWLSFAAKQSIILHPYQEDGMENNNRLGGRIRQLREDRQLTREQLAERSQLTVAMLGSIEDGALVPSLTPLIKLARSLGVRLGTFLDDQPELGPVITRAAGAKQVMRVSDKCGAQPSDLNFFALAANKQDRHMEPFLLEIFPSSAEDCHLSSHEGEEFIYLLSGSIEVIYGTARHTLAPGDSIYLDSIVAHHVHSVGPETAKALAVIFAPC